MTWGLLMVMNKEFGLAVASAFEQNAWQKTVEISVVGKTSQEVNAIIDSVIEACAAQSIALKGIAVDAGLVAMPASSEFWNAFIRKGVVVVVDINLDDKVVVRRK